MALQRTGSPTLFLAPDGSVREVQNGEIVVMATAKPAKGYDCEAAVRWAIFHGGLNSALAGCVRAMCGAVNCREFGACGGLPQEEHDARTRYLCGFALLSED
jgi:hypothetical protein